MRIRDGWTLALLAVTLTASRADAQTFARPRFVPDRRFVTRVPERAFLNSAPLPQYLLLQPSDTSEPKVRNGGIARVAYAKGIADYWWIVGANGTLIVVTGGIDTSDRMVLVHRGDILRGRASYTGCCGGPPEPRAIEATQIRCDAVPRSGKA